MDSNENREEMDPGALDLDAQRLAKSRLRLGIANVGFWTLLALFVLGTPFFDGIAGSGGAGAWGLMALALGIQWAFDYLGGCVLTPAPRPGLRGFLRRWFRGAMVHTLILGGMGGLTLWSYSVMNAPTLAIVIGSMLLASGRLRVLEWVRGQKLRPHPVRGMSILALEAQDPSFTGGLTGWGRRVENVAPRHWMDGLSEREWRTEMARRTWQTMKRLPMRAFVFVTIWNAVGGTALSLALRLERLEGAALLVHYAAMMTLWGFVGLLLLPSLSRASVFAADFGAGVAGLSAVPWIRRVPQITGEDGSATSWTQRIFYPIPRTTDREQKVREGFSPEEQRLVGSVARENLYYSWATFTWLGRAVHCNCGRPELWVFAPNG